MSAERVSTPRGLQPRQVPLSFLQLPSLHPTSTAPSFSALPCGCWGYRAGKEVPAGVSRGWVLVAPHCKAERSGRKMKSLHVASVARQKLCKACLLAMKNYPERRFLSCERHLLIIPTGTALTLTVLPLHRFPFLPLTCLYIFRNLSRPLSSHIILDAFPKMHNFY